MFVWLSFWRKIFCQSNEKAHFIRYMGVCEIEVFCLGNWIYNMSHNSYTSSNTKSNFSYFTTSISLLNKPPIISTKHDFFQTRGREKTHRAIRKHVPSGLLESLGKFHAKFIKCVLVVAETSSSFKSIIHLDFHGPLSLFTNSQEKSRNLRTFWKQSTISPKLYSFDLNILKTCQSYHQNKILFLDANRVKLKRVMPLLLDNVIQNDSGSK